MASEGSNGAAYRMQSRINLKRTVAEQAPSALHQLFARKDDCENDQGGNKCEKPSTIGSMGLWIGLAVAIPAVVAIIVLVYLHRRNVKRQRLEDANDPHRDLDFGLGDAPIPSGGKKQRRSLMFGGNEKSHKTNQLSMDMNLSSPYLLPPGVQNSHDSVNTLGKGFDEHDPYRMVTPYLQSESGSVRSFGKDTGAYSKRASIMTGKSGRSQHTMRMPPPPRSATLPKTPQSPSEKVDPFATPKAPEPALRNPSQPAELESPMVPVQPVVPEIGTVTPYPDEKRTTEEFKMPEIQEPPTAVARSTGDRYASPARGPSPNPDNIGMANSGEESYGRDEREGLPAGLGLNFDIVQPQSPMDETMFSHSSPQQPGQAMSQDRQSKDSYYEDYQPQLQASEYYDDYEDYGRGRSAEREEPAAQPRQDQGLAIPQQDNKRLSVGFRPLPPDDVTESEDPEYRANRIRSFYKEYFDDGGKDAPPVPSMPTNYHAGGHGGSQHYYEDYDDRYMGEAAYFDPDSNAFVMPYAQPVHRRAMTPPPAGRRGMPGPGPRGPPRGPNGSIGGMSLPGGPGRRRAGSSAYGGSRAPSSLGPRPDSSASARFRQPPRKKLPPPQDLSTLPTPSKLKDDSYALMSAADFAPPESFQSRARGRSQSPMGERRAYNPKLPAASPLVNTYEEMAHLPSPHLLRKSSTFTGLDFAPPKKFKNEDTMSDAGSIRSNRSGVSSLAQSAIRGGAGRVSRLPEDAVFTQAALGDQLKPQWTMRP